jgi:hypothetical protein
MKKILALIFSISLTTAVSKAQSVYELSFTFPAANTTVAYKACYVDAADGKAKVRLNFY